MNTKSLVIASLLIGTQVFGAESKSTIENEIQKNLKAHHSLKDFYVQLSKEYGQSAVGPLTKILEDEAQPDEVRWASIFGLAKLTGKDSLKLVSRFFTHPSWMLRDAALKTAAALDAHELRPQIEARLHDEALAIRTTAVDTIGHLNLRESAEKLVDALFDPINYHAGKSLWIHKHILDVLVDLHYESCAARLVQLLETKNNDGILQRHLIATLEKLTGRSFQDKSLKEQIYLWKRNTLSDVVF